MKNDELFEIIGDISDRHIEGAKKHKSTGVWKRWTALAACLCVIVAAAFMITLRVPQSNSDSGSEPDYREDDYPVDNGTSNLGASETSDKYNNLTELLTDLSRNDYHDGTLDANGGRNLSSVGDSVTFGAKAAAYNGYVYRIADGCVEILDFGGDVKNTIDFDAHEIFICGDRIVLRGVRTVGNELEYESYSIVCTYMLRDPLNPEFLEKYEQKGEFVDCYIAGDKIYLLTTDGVCACGYSRLDDVSEYVPTFDGEPWNQNEITILGEPASVNYLAVSAANIQGGISSMRAFYGDIDNVFYGEDWIAIVTHTVTEDIRTQPDVYTFDEDLEFTGKIDFNQNQIENEGRFKVTSVFKTENTFGVFGVYTHTQEDNSQISGYKAEQKILIAAKNMVTGEESFELLDMDAERCGIDDIFFEDGKTIICVSTMYNIDDPDTVSDGNRFIIAELDDGKIVTNIADFVTDRVDGVEQYFSYGSPYGSLETLIPMEDGIYLRYNGVPNGFDILDFSGNTPVLIYKSEGEIAEDERFDFIWHKFDKNVFGVMHMKMGAGQEIRETEFSYRIYSVDPYSDSPFVLINEYSFAQTGTWSSGLGFEVFEYEEEYYFVSDFSDGVTKIKW